MDLRWVFGLRLFPICLLWGKVKSLGRQYVLEFQLRISPEWVIGAVYWKGYLVDFSFRDNILGKVRIIIWTPRRGKSLTILKKGTIWWLKLGFHVLLLRSCTTLWRWNCKINFGTKTENLQENIRMFSGGGRWIYWRYAYVESSANESYFEKCVETCAYEDEPIIASILKDMCI